MTPHIPTPLLCPATSRWRVPTPQGWLYLNSNDTRFLALSHPNPLTRPHAPQAYAGPTAESYTTAYNIAAANAAGRHMSTDARVNWHYVQDVGPSARWNKMKGEWRTVPEMGSTEGKGVDWKGGDWRTRGADGRTAASERTTVTDDRGRTVWPFGGTMERTNGSDDVVEIQGLNWDPARLPWGVMSTRVAVEEESDYQAETRGVEGQARKPIARLALYHTAGNGMNPGFGNAGKSDGDKVTKVDPSIKQT